MVSALTQAELFALLAAGETIVVPHAHAAHTLRSRFARQHTPHLSQTEPGQFLAWHEWTASLWSSLTFEGVEMRVLLNRAQEESLWAEIFARNPATPDTRPSSSRQQAELARSGLRLAAAYNAVERLRSAADTFDSRAFALWVDAFRSHCTQHRLLAPALLEQTLVRHLRTGSLAPPPPVYLAGFEQLTPSQRDLLTALQAVGTTVHSCELRHSQIPDRTGRAIIAAGAREQLDFAVRWIAEQARSHPQTFALITPRAEDHTPELERLFRQHLAPELEAVDADLSSTPWLFTARPSLTVSPVVSHALDLLRWTVEPLSLERIGRLLLSPYFGHAEPLEDRARFEAFTLRQSGLLRPELDLQQFRDVVNTSHRRRPPARFPELQSLCKLLEQKNPTQGTRHHADWADQVRHMVSALGWPGPRTLSPGEFAAVEAWEGLLDLLSTVDIDGRRLSFGAYLRRLGSDAGHAALPLPTFDAPVQVLTLAEAEGLSFDCVLILDATDRNFPMPESLHPLLPRRLQSALAMPGSEPRLTCERTRVRLQSLMARSGTVSLIAPAKDNSGPLRLTLLASELQLASSHATLLLPPVPPTEPIVLAEFDEPPLPTLPSSVVHGGARVLELQSNCGFRAFADLRLRAEEPNTPALGLDAREAGRILHLAFQELWGSLKEQAVLRALSTAERRAAVRHAVQTALDPLSRSPNADRPWPLAFRHILEARFVHLLTRWLKLELDRDPFTIVAQEQEHGIQVGPLELKVRPDRIDKVAQGLVYIDYKTAYALSTGDWLGERPDAPQLPLYTLLAEPDTVRGVAFARVRPGQAMGWISLSDTPGTFPDSRRSQHDLGVEIEAWRHELTRLAQDFANGKAQVDPKTYPKTCQYCAHRVLCRINPAEHRADLINEDDLFEEEIDG